MKINITLSLDEGIVFKLKKENNYSKVVNEQMKVYYNTPDSENKKILRQNLVEIKQILKINRKKQRLINKQLDIIEERAKVLRCPECDRVMINATCFKCGIKILKGGNK